MPETPTPLRLLAEDADDLAVISAALQDAVGQIGDIAYEAGRAAADPGAQPLPLGAGRRAPSGCAPACSSARCWRSRRASCAASQPDAVVELLAVEFEPGEAPGGGVLLHFAGGGDLRARGGVHRRGAGRSLRSLARQARAGARRVGARSAATNALSPALRPHPRHAPLQRLRSRLRGRLRRLSGRAARARRPRSTRRWPRSSSGCGSRACARLLRLRPPVRRRRAGRGVASTSRPRRSRPGAAACPPEVREAIAFAARPHPRLSRAPAAGRRALHRRGRRRARLALDAAGGGRGSMCRAGARPIPRRC